MTAGDEERARGGAPPRDAGNELTAGALAADPHLRIHLRRVAGESGLDRPVRHPRVQKCGLALAGHFTASSPPAFRSSARPSSRTSIR